MKNLLSAKITAIILSLAVLISIGFYACMLVRPISYGMEYHTETVYEDQVFEGTVTFQKDGTMVNRNSNFDEAITSYYHYKDGYLFFLLSETKESCEAEVAYINDSFEEAVGTPFYAAKINALRYTVNGMDGYSSVYTCTSAIAFAAGFGVVVTALIALLCASLVLCKKSKGKESVACE